jgi:hypothetical protein
MTPIRAPKCIAAYLHNCCHRQRKSRPPEHRRRVWRSCPSPLVPPHPSPWKEAHRSEPPVAPSLDKRKASSRPRLDIIPSHEMPRVRTPASFKFSSHREPTPGAHSPLLQRVAVEALSWVLCATPSQEGEVLSHPLLDLWLRLDVTRSTAAWTQFTCFSTEKYFRNSGKWPEP